MKGKWAAKGAEAEAVFEGSRAVVLNLWVATPWGRMTLSQGSHIRYPAY